MTRCAALTVAHAAGVTLRAVRLDQIRVTADGRWVVADTSLALPMPCGAEYVYCTRAESELAHTWLAPEAISDGLYGDWSDAFAFGLLVYELMLGDPRGGRSDADFASFLSAGGRVAVPRGAPDLVTTMIECCVDPVPHMRPLMVRAIDIIDMTLASLRAPAPAPPPPPPAPVRPVAAAPRRPPTPPVAAARAPQSVPPPPPVAPPATPPSRPASPELAESRVVPRVRFCIECGMGRFERAKFCAGCGTRFPVIE
jgi:hypothetical protein